MPIYEVIVTETIKKVVHVEAEDEKKAQLNLSLGKTITETTERYEVEKPRRVSW